MIKADWPAPTWINAITTTKFEGNFGHCKDGDVQAIALRRNTLCRDLGLSAQPIFLDQVHGAQVIETIVGSDINAKPYRPAPIADGIWTERPGLPCAVLTADCLPLVLCDEAGTIISTLHCGWRSLQQDIIQVAVNTMRPKAKGALMAWMGPAIGPQVFEVGQDVYQAFVSEDVTLAQAFELGQRPGKWLANIYQIARLKCRQAGVTAVYGGSYCTYSQPDTFYSYRKDPNAGRMLTLAWMTPH